MEVPGRIFPPNIPTTKLVLSTFFDSMVIIGHNGSNKFSIFWNSFHTLSLSIP
jgi:hypothetical protein